jgi:hypothetical protein
MRASDLTADEQKNVRLAIRYLRARCGGWITVAKALHATRETLIRVSTEKEPVSASMAFRVARLAAVSIDDVLTGKYPSVAVCRKCGHPIEEGADAR